MKRYKISLKGPMIPVTILVDYQLCSGNLCRSIKDQSKSNQDQPKISEDQKSLIVVGNPFFYYSEHHNIIYKF